MKPSSISKKLQAHQHIKCFTVFFLMLAPVPYLIVECNRFSNSAFLSLLFFTGWFIWTFAEYVLHRFWNHAKDVDKNNSIVQRHHHHHTHPTEISISATQRIIMMFIVCSLVGLSLWLNSYVMILAGMGTGIFWFFQMHYFLHQKWAKKIFPVLVRYHVVHHCKEPDTCFGITTSWWDRIFGTTPHKDKKISEKVIAFYYKKEKTTGNGFLVSSMIDEKLNHVGLGE